MKTSYPKLRRAVWKDGSSSDDAVSPGSNVIHIEALTPLDLHPDKVLLAALDQMESVCVFGWDRGGHLYVASSIANGPELLWMLRLVERQLFEAAEQIQTGEIS